MWGSLPGRIPTAFQVEVFCSSEAAAKWIMVPSDVLNNASKALVQLQHVEVFFGRAGFASQPQGKLRPLPGGFSEFCRCALGSNNQLRNRALVYRIQRRTLHLGIVSSADEDDRPRRDARNLIRRIKLKQRAAETGIGKINR